MATQASKPAATDGTHHAPAPAALYDGGFQAIPNFRDVAVTVNTHTGRKLVRPGLLFRSARPDEATLADRDRLRSHYGIRTVMDLRSKTEHVQAARKRSAEGRVPALLRTNEALARPVQIPGLEYREVRITGKAFERYMLSQLGWWSFIKLIAFYIVGLRMRAVAILGREVMSPRGLIGLGCDTLDASGDEVAAGLRGLLGPHGLPVLIHCTQGKDRTGIMVVLVLLVCGVPVGAVQHDYHLTDEKLVSETEGRLREIREMGLGDDWARTAPGFVAGVVSHLDGRYGGLDAYLDGIGFGSEERGRLRQKLLY